MRKTSEEELLINLNIAINTITKNDCLGYIHKSLKFAKKAYDFFPF